MASYRKSLSIGFIFEEFRYLVLKIGMMKTTMQHKVMTHITTQHHYSPTEIPIISMVFDVH